MSEKFVGVTFAKQKVTPSDDAIVRRAILPDGILAGCELSYSGSTLTMSAGHLMLCGRQIRIPSVQNWAVVDATSGFARLVLTIDLTRTATKDAFDQVIDVIEYASAEGGFVSLEQTDINETGTRYQLGICTISLGPGGITGIVSQIEKCEVGAGLNFKVVGGLTQPSGPKKNTIWVKTDQKITSWIFSTLEPSGPEEGMVWFITGTSSAVEFNALKKNGIQVYPDSAKQYIDGTWKDVPVQSCQNGQWVDWIKYLYNNGDECTGITGGWESVYDNTGSFYSKATVTKTESSIKLSGATETMIAAATKNALDVTDWNTVFIKLSNVANMRGALALFPSGKTLIQSNFAAATWTTKKEGIFSLDVSTLTGKHRIAYYMAQDTYAGSGEINEVWYE